MMAIVSSGLRDGLWGFAILCAVTAPAAAQVWVPQGPAPNTQGQVENILNREVAGAINAVAPHPTDANIVYVAAVNGGLWKSTNAMAAAPTWVRQSDFQASLTMGALEFDPTDAGTQTLLAGSGRSSSFGDGGALTGLLRTTNGGATWTAINGGGVLNGANIFGVAPRGNTFVLATTNRGVLRSTDGGTTWATISGGTGTGLPTGAAFDLASDPTNNARLFTNAGATGIFRSTDTGATWTAVSSAAMNTMMGGGLSNVDIAVGRNNNVYVAIVTGGRLAGVFRSGDGGTTWTAMDLPTTVEGGIHPGGQGRIHLSLAADPTNHNIVYIGGDRQPSPFPNSIGANDFSGRLFRGDASQPAGTQFVHLTHSSAVGPAGGGTANSSSPHADSRDMDVAANGVLIEADDGGVYRRTNPQNDTGNWFSMNGNLQPTEFHSAAWDSRSHIVIGGAQDTGTPAQIATGLPTFRSVATADGGVVTVDDISTPGFSTRYSSNQNLGSFRRQVFDAANVFQSQVFPTRTPIGGSPAMTAQFYTPIKVNNVTGTRLIFGAGNAVYESFDQGDTVRSLTPAVVANGSGPHTVAYGAAGNPDILYVGSGARVFVRTAAPPAALVQSATYPGGFVLGITLDPNAPNTAYVVDAANVFRTTDAGATWTTLTGNLLTLLPGSLRSVAFGTTTPDGAVFVGTDRGVFFARGCGGFTVWQRLGSGLPFVPVFQLEFDAADRVLLAGTLGRGAWTLPFGAAVGNPQIQIPGTVTFGDSCVAGTSQATLNICNTGKADLVVDPIASSNPRFTVTTPSAGYPVVISPDFCFPFQVAFNPTAAGPQTAKLSFATNDAATACASTDVFGNATITDVRVTGSTDFGVSSTWDANEKIVKVCNTGACNLSVPSVSVAGADYALVSNPFPATVSPDSCLDVTVGFEPTLPGRRTGSLTVSTNDPDTPSVVRQLTGRSPSYFSIAAGASLPHGALNTVADAGSTVNLAFTYPFLPNWAWDVRVGYAAFAGATALPDVNVWSVLGNIKYLFNPPATVKVFVNGGAGLYQFDPGDAEFGFNIGGGVQVPLNRRFSIEGTYNYNHALTASPNRRFSQIQGGLLIYF
jgi:hypothetical protein